MVALAAYVVSTVPRSGFASAPPAAVCEARGQYAGTTDLPSEAVLSELWAGQRFPEDALLTIEGERVRVLHPGMKGRGAGPDFRHARIGLPRGLVLLGDVELHVRATDFRAHGHHHDSRYNSVVLHVVFEDDIGANTLLASGQRVPVIELAPRSRRRATDIAGWLERSDRWQEPCHDAVSRLGQAGVVAVIETLGDQRFRSQAAVLGQEIDTCGAGAALYHALLDAVNLGSERDVARTVANALPWACVRPVLLRQSALEHQAPALENQTILEALLLGSAGLQPAAPGWNAPNDQPARFRVLPAPARPSAAYRGRPVSHPARRLAGLAALLVRHRDLLLGSSPPDNSCQLTPSALIAGWTVTANAYWQRHVAPGQPATRSPGALIGRGRAVELLTNAVLPWLLAVAERAGDHAEAERARALYAELPAPARYGRLLFLEQLLSNSGTPLKRTARRQQGLLALYQTECTQGGCGRCPLS